MPRLQVLNGKRQGANFEVGRAGVVVGHRNTAPVSIDDPWVSWDHARIFVQGDAFWIEDLGSTNGTFVNCVRVKRERLNHEDIIFFGKTHVIFLVPELSSVSGDNDPSKSDEKKRSSFEVNLAEIAAAAQWAAPTATPPTRGGGPSVKNGQNGRGSGVQATTVAPRPADELAPLTLPPFAQELAGEPGEESSRSRHDPFRPGADPWDQGGNARGNNNKGSSALLNLDPDADPFSSARAEGGKGDPFSVGQDPFEGPRRRSVAETQHDMGDAPNSSGARPTSEDGSFSTPQRPGFENFDIDEREPDTQPVAPVSAAEVSSLLEAQQKSNDGEDARLDDLDALLGDNAARTPDPGVYASGPPGRASSGTTKRKPSEALTRPIDTTAVNDAVSEGKRAAPANPAPKPKPSGRIAAPPPPMTPRAPSPVGRGTGTKIAPLPPELGNASSMARTQPLAAQNPAPPPPPPPPPPPAAKLDEPRPTSPADLAFEVAKLQDEVNRLRLALAAARQADPEKVRVAVEGLRTEELGRQARDIADLRRELALLAESHKKTQAELDDVTSEMIAKEDAIDALKTKLAERESGAAPEAGRPGRAGESADELRALEF